MADTLRMAELLSTRLCHDLTGPIGAVNNGAEFLSEEGFNLQSQAVELIVSSAFSAVTRLQFYRVAYGKVKEQGEANLADKQKLAFDYFAGSKITLDWPDHHTDSSGVSVSVKMSRLLFNLLIVASHALIRGGTIAVRLGHTPEGGKQLTVTAQGNGLKWDAETDKILSGTLSEEELSPKNVQTFLTWSYVEDLGAKLACTASGDLLTMTVSQPPENAP